MIEYFSHDYYSRSDRKLVTLAMKHGMAGIGIFWCIVEMLYESDGKIMLTECERIAFELRDHPECIRDVINDSGLFENDGTYFWSESVLKRIEIRNSKSQKSAKAAEIRWNNARAMRTHSGSNAIKENKRKEKKKDNTIECETLYKLYPSRDINNEDRSTGKSSKDKDKIDKLLDKHSFEDLKKIFESYLSDAARTKSYIKNFSTFLNQLPEVPEESVQAETKKPTFEFPEPVRVREKVMQRFPGWREYDYWPSDFDLDAWHWMYMELVINDKRRSLNDIVEEIKLRLEPK